MTRLDEFRLLDPVDPSAPVPDGEALLREILRDAPPPQLQLRPRRRRPHRLRVVAAVATCATVAGVALALPGPGTDVVAAAYDAVHDPDTILHYTQRWSQPESALGPAQDFGTVEVWQAGDGSRQRALQNLGGMTGHESVVDGEGSRTYVPGSHEIIEYKERAELPAAPGGVGRAELGDPRTLLARARRGDVAVQELGEAEVRGIPVLQFRVGECRVSPRRRLGDGGFSQEIRYASVVSVARDDYTPVRVEQPPCEPPQAGAQGATLEQMPGMTIDYVDFEVLPVSEEATQRLQMSPHPGAPVRDGEDIDAAEERDER